MINADRQKIETVVCQQHETRPHIFHFGQWSGRGRG